jgi:hypothetical protein
VAREHRHAATTTALRLGFLGAIQSLAQFRHDAPQIKEALQILDA